MEVPISPKVSSEVPAVSLEVPAVSTEVSVEEQFYEACANGQMDVIDSLLEFGIDVNAPFKGMLPLHQACRSEEPWALDVVTKLLTRGVDVDLEDVNGCNAIDHVLVYPFRPHVAQLLLDCSKKGVNRLDSEGYNYLWSTGNHPQITMFLVENGIDINHVTEDLSCLRYRTYLDYADEDYDYLRSIGAKLYSEL